MYFNYKNFCLKLKGIRIGDGSGYVVNSVRCVLLYFQLWIKEFRVVQEINSNQGFDVFMCNVF